MRIAVDFLRTHWLALSLAAIAALIYIIAQIRALRSRGPKALTGNGITVGRAKAFDNRSLTLRIERLSASLAALNVVNQNLTEGLAAFQGMTSSERSNSLSVTVKPGANRDQDNSSKDRDAEKPEAAAKSEDQAKADNKSGVGIAASDILNDQLNLASQIVNLEMLYERSLTDRLIDGKPRLQTVLGFQISISPPAGFDDCVAVAEVGVRVKNTADPVSLVALIPQEKTYNAQSVSTSAKSIGGSAVASVVTLGFSSKGEARQLFIHRDSDTIAFERNSAEDPPLFAQGPRGMIFGWEFRPVLARRTVSAGTRQMLAVVALPQPESDVAEDTVLEIVTRSYWLRYDAKKQTTRGKWHLLPFKVDGSRRNDSLAQEVAVPNIKRIQEALTPTVREIRWVNSGADRATVIVRGSNFFSGTKVVLGGVVHREEDATLTLKSDQALEFETTIGSLATGDSVVSGRFGSSFQLAVPKDKLPVAGLGITRATIRPSRYTKAFRIRIELKGLNADGLDTDLTLSGLAKLPEPILFVGTDPVPMPYDYDESEDPAKRKTISVEAWIPAKTLARSPSVAFRVPFCGSEYHASQPLSFSEPTVTRMGSDKATTVFRIANPIGFSSSIQVSMDKNYEEGSPEVTKTSDVDYELRLPTDVVSQYQNLVVRMGTAEPYVLPIPGEDRPKPKPVIQSAKPPQIKQGALGPVEWSGTALDAISTATLYAPPSAQPGCAATFTTYEDGVRIEVYFSEGSTMTVGKAEVEFQTASTETIRVPLVITKP